MVARPNRSVLPPPGSSAPDWEAVGSRFALTSAASPHLAEKAAGGVGFWIANDFDSPAAGEHFVALRHSLARVVRALGLNVGTKLADQRTDVRLVKNDHRIDV